METNRDYISWSAYSLWKSSKFSFYKKYVLGEEVSTPAFDKGNEFSKYRETQQLPPYEVDPLLAPVSKSIPIIGETEHKIEVDFIDSKLLCYIDEVKDDKTHFNEYKTGKIPWDNIQVSQHEQLPFYALCMYLKYNIIPTCTLYWIETEEVEINGEKLIRYTGQVESFERKFTEEDLINFGTILNKTLIEIKEYEFEELECDLDIASKYIELTEQKKHIENQIELIKMQMHEEFISTGATRSSCDLGYFSLSERKTPIFSSELQAKEQKYKDEIAELKAKEKLDPKTKYSISQTVLFKPTKSK